MTMGFIQMIINIQHKMAALRKQNTNWRANTNITQKKAAFGHPISMDKYIIFRKYKYIIFRKYKN